MTTEKTPAAQDDSAAPASAAELDFDRAWDEATAPPSDTPAAAAVAEDDELAAAAAEAKTKTTDQVADAAATESVGAPTGGGAGAAAGGGSGQTTTPGGAAVTDAEVKSDVEAKPDAATTITDSAPAEPPEIAELRRQLAERDTELAQLRAKPAATDKPAADTATTTDATPSAPPIYTADEEAVISEYQKEWPDVAKGEALVRRKEYHNLVTHIFAQVSKVYGPILERALATSEHVAVQTADAIITSVHSDYSDEMVDKVTEWAKGLKGMRGKVALSIIEDGEPEDVVELISEWKEATKKASGDTTPPRVVVDNTKTNPKSAPSPAKDKALTPEAIQAAAALAARDTKRTTVGSSEADPNDFDSAWDEATRPAAK